jgi:hypothetical protein
MTEKSLTALQKGSIRCQDKRNKYLQVQRTVDKPKDKDISKWLRNLRTTGLQDQRIIVDECTRVYKSRGRGMKG